MLLNDPSKINNLILANEENFNESERKIIKNKIGNSSSIDCFNLVFKTNDSLTEFNGYTKVNIEKVEEMIYVLSDTEISKTKLLKEMSYSDFLFYRDTGKSITGLEYIKLQHGPVPDKFSFLIDFCYSENVIDYKVNLYKDREYNAITSKELKVTKLSNEELEIINKVKKYTENGIYDRILIASPTVNIDDEIGYLPGDIDEKVGPYLGGIMDNLWNYFKMCDEYSNNDDIQDKIDELFARNYIEIQGIGFLRGRSIKDNIFIIDEAQNIRPEILLDIVTRVGKGTKIVLMGDPTQVNRVGLNIRRNGLVYISEKMKGSSLCWQVTLNNEKSVRSDLAQEALRILQK